MSRDLNFGKIGVRFYHNRLPMCLLRFILLTILLFFVAPVWADELNLDFVPYEDLTQSEQKGVSQACSGKFVNNFNKYSHDIAEGAQKAQSKTQSLQDQTWILDGNAMLVEKSIVLLSDTIEMNQLSGETSLAGQSQMRFAEIMLQGEQVEMDIKQHTGTVRNAQFVIHASNVNGSADEIRRDEEGIFYLKNFTISRCNPDQRSWWLKGSSLKINPNTGMITSVNNWLWVAGIPVFFTPYIHMPYDDHATSGLLVPTWALSDGKFSEFNQPIYFRFKPNLDMTTTVSFLRQSIFEQVDESVDINAEDYEPETKELSGWLINNELRFLGHHHEGQLLGAYSNMPSQTQENSLPNIDRYYYKFQQKWFFNGFTSDVELNGLSDVYFFQDFYAGEETHSVHQTIKNRYTLEDSLIYQTIDASWALERGDDDFHRLHHTLNTKESGWDLYFKQQWQSLDGRKAIIFEEENEDSEQYVAPAYAYQLAPGIEANYKSAKAPDFRINQNVSIQLSNFDLQLPDSLRETVDLNEQLRMAGKATYQFPMTAKLDEINATYKLKPSLMLQGAMYPGWVAPDELDNSYLAGMVSFTQTLDLPVELNSEQQLLIQPEHIRQYAPLVDTSYLPVLDTAASASSYGNGLRFTGMDRFGDVNQSSYGVKLNLQHNKRTHTQIGLKQRKFHDREWLQLNSVLEIDPEVDEDFERFSDYSVQASFTPDSATVLSGQWNYSNKWEIKTGQVEFKYNLPTNHYIRLTSNTGHRVIVDETQPEDSDKKGQTELLSHSISLSGQWAINPQLGFIGYGKWQYDLLNEENHDYQLEEMAMGLEYDDCCWAFRMLSYNNLLDDEHEDNKIYFQVIFKGMGRIDQGFDAIVDEYIPAYPGSLFEQD